ncbi:MAG: hypothetical protein JRC56_01175 [Deltaproteobacteria bacterium]|nr:hypothetical protein [Deltaproteobacteria bacterium]MBW2619931.1 hypothetical protein [Deltaproteobacteria bacterium]MBW2642797.1 hypothetical protein [Deltaproteobacteria bacterium]
MICQDFFDNISNIFLPRGYAARLLDEYQIPVSVVSDGKTAMVIDTVSGEKIGEGLDAIPSKKALQETAKSLKLQQLAEKLMEREKLI